jgi:hypothetical protein
MEYRPVHPAPAIVAIVVLTSAATTTALAYFQALAQEAARDTYEFLKRRLKPGDSLPDHGTDHGDKEATARTASPDYLSVIDDAERITVNLPTHLPAAARMAVPALNIQPVPHMWVTISWEAGAWKVTVRELDSAPRHHEPGPGPSTVDKP